MPEAGKREKPKGSQEDRGQSPSIKRRKQEGRSSKEAAGGPKTEQ